MACRVVHALTADLEPDPLDQAQVLAGSPQTAVRELLDAGEVSIGLWQHTAGSSTDVETDEVFVVLAGRATIEVADGPVLEVGPGDVGVLEAGARTRWHVHETLRKVYVLLG